MSEIIRNAAVVGLLASYVVAFVNMFRVASNRKEGVRLPRWYQNPFNIIFQSDELSERGLTARRLVVYGLLGVLLSGTIAVVADHIARLK